MGVILVFGIFLRVLAEDVMASTSAHSETSLPALKDLFGVNLGDTATKHFFDTPKTCTMRNVLWLYPSEDHNGAFEINTNVEWRLKGWYRMACSVHVWRVGSVEEATRIVKAYTQRSLMNVVLGGHGSGTSLEWGASKFWSSNVTGWYLGETTELAVGSWATIEFFKALNSRMSRHGTVFMDSCLSGTSCSWSWQTNLAQWTSQQFTKGIRVFGATESFSHVGVGRFGPYYHINDLSKGKAVWYDSPGARCYPTGGQLGSDLRFTLPKEGVCTCPVSTMCMLPTGDPCPSADGKTSRTNFLPACASHWVGDDERCECAAMPEEVLPEPPVKDFAQMTDTELRKLAETAEDAELMMLLQFLKERKQARLSHILVKRTVSTPKSMPSPSAKLLEQFTVKELKRVLQSRGSRTAGLKVALINRVGSVDATELGKALRVSDLKAILKRQGRRSSGRKADLIRRVLGEQFAAEPARSSRKRRYSEEDPAFAEPDRKRRKFSLAEAREAAPSTVVRRQQ